MDLRPLDDKDIADSWHGVTSLASKQHNGCANYDLISRLCPAIQTEFNIVKRLPQSARRLVRLCGSRRLEKAKEATRPDAIGSFLPLAA
jgi:hypothetical protein